MLKRILHMHTLGPLIYRGQFLTETKLEKQDGLVVVLKFTFESCCQIIHYFLRVSPELFDSKCSHLTDERFWDLVCEEIAKVESNHV